MQRDSQRPDLTQRGLPDPSFNLGSYTDNASQVTPLFEPILLDKVDNIYVN